MNNFNPNIHHRHSIRLKTHDYSSAGLYYITICVQDRICLFGNIDNGELEMNEAGKIADECWLEIPEHFKNVVLHAHILMPNHIHGIIELKHVDTIPNHIVDNAGTHVGTRHVVSLPYNDGVTVGPSHVMALPDNSDNSNNSNNLNNSDNSDNPVNPINSDNPIYPDKSEQPSQVSAQQNQFSRPIPGSISVIIQQYKASVTRLINKNYVSHFRWQSRFYEHIIRSDKSYELISDYIINNPKNWKDDDLFIS